MSAPVIGVLALQGDVPEHLTALTVAGAVAGPVRRPEELARVDGLVVPGGESTTISKLAALFGLMEPLRARVRDGMPVYGTCAGMILLADKILDPRAGQETIGGIDMIVRRNAFGRQNESFEAAVDVRGVEGDPVEGVFIRAPWVESVGAETEVLAEHDGHIVAVRQGNALATSFHPELTGDHRMHALFVAMVRGNRTPESL
ncbi:pyridoxal 5'-phosphate synthase subunit PdxT [Streptomyces ruber]|uniref:Pyridoxal 5'-phosphate synthase subunit PdxT n=2 Tax=Streptomyces TaxID=1883 RepID=A0A918BCJ3_9ACTN|nr:pyridoxal 5'-phosphate synthase glutaminase subunit PdxT [Streptomyces ruber]GGQ58887.1 pyridoxal 5'-phosphate synthase subunit PdxT [Streptomyces ruber]